MWPRHLFTPRTVVVVVLNFCRLHFAHVVLVFDWEHHMAVNWHLVLLDMAGILTYSDGAKYASDKTTEIRRA